MKTLVSIIIIIILFITPIYADDTPARVGTTFSQVQCEYFEMDWKKEYLNALDKNFAIIRLGSYWNEIEKTEGIYDFTILDWQIAEAAKKNVPIMLTVGMKAPRWPEYFIPEWLMAKLDLHYSADVSKNKILCDKVLNFIEQVILRYKDEDIIQYWQVENEPLDHTGPKRWWINKEFLKKEIDLVKKLDNNKRPIIINTATYPNRLLRLFSGALTTGSPIKQAIDLGDIYGMNVYQTIGDRFLGADIYYRSRKKERNKYYKNIVNLAAASGKKVIVTELQAEPWDPGLLVHTGKEKAITCSPADMKEIYTELTSLGIKTILLWGVEYWEFRAQEHKDDEWWHTAKGLIDNN